MPLYSCKTCNFFSYKKYDYTRHLKTKKHLKNISANEDLGLDDEKKRKKNYKKKMSQNEPKRAKNEPKMSQNEPKRAKNEPKRAKNEKNKSKKKVLKSKSSKFVCEYCQKTFSTKPILRRHELHRCKKRYDNNLNTIVKRMVKEKETLYKQIEMLIEKAGDTTTNNNITNNIQINGFGSEDTSYITEKMLDGLLIYPGTMVPNLVALTHFNKDHPENKNLKITNVKSKYVKIYSDGKWILQNKEDVIDNIMNSNYIVLDDHYSEKAKNKLEKHKQKEIEKFMQALETEEMEVVKNIKDCIELTILNNSDT